MTRGMRSNSIYNFRLQKLERSHQEEGEETKDPVLEPLERILISSDGALPFAALTGYFEVFRVQPSLCASSSLLSSSLLSEATWSIPL